MSSQFDEAVAEFRAFQVKAAAPGPVIRVNGVAIETASVLREAQNHPADDPKAALDAAARALVVRELLLQEARRKGIAASPATDAEGRAESEEEALISGLLAVDVVTPKADAEACRRYYGNNIAKFRSPDLYEARHILIAAVPEDDAAKAGARTLAEQLIVQLQEDPGRFAELAAAHSACPSKEHGGNLGQLTRGQTVPEFETFLFNLAEGQLCPVPVATRFGFHVIQLDRRIAGRVLDFDLVQSRIADYLEAASWNRAIAQYLSILAGAAKLDGISLDGATSPLVQ